MALNGKSEFQDIFLLMMPVIFFKVKDDQIFVDERQIIWGNTDLETTIPILPRGLHKFPFK